MKRCLTCGKIIQSNNLTLCSKCGGNLIKAEDFPEIEDDSSESKDSKKKNVFIALLMIALAILTVLCCFFARQLYTKNTEISKQADKKILVEKQIKEKQTEAGDYDNQEVQIEVEHITGGETIPDDFDVEAEVKRIREMQTNVEKSELATFTEGETVKAFYDGKGNIVKITANPDEKFDYARQYYFEDGELYFAFVFIGANIENRLYFYSGNLFRWIDGPQGEQEFHDLEFDSSEFKNWEKIVKEDSNQKYSMFL